MACPATVLGSKETLGRARVVLSVGSVLDSSTPVGLVTGDRSRVASAIALGAAVFCLAWGSLAAEPPAPPPEPPLAPGEVIAEPAQPEPLTPPLSSLPYFPVNVSLLYPLAFNVGRPTLLTNLDIALLVSRVGAVQGVQVGVLTYTEFDLQGIQASVAAISGTTKGAQIGATFAFADGAFNGLQFAGVFAWSDKTVTGAQIAGVSSQSSSDVHGLQLSGGVNIARGEVRGVQAAGLLNIGRVEGLQIGLINVSAEIKGLQVGIFNVARKIDGFQLGLVNITDSLSGESLGVANLLKPGSIHLSLWGSNSLLGNAGLKFSSKYTYSILSAAIDSATEATTGHKKALFGAGLTFGLHYDRPLALEGVAVSGDIGGYRLFRDGFSFDGHDELLKARLYLSYSIASRLTVFGGGGAYLGFRGDDDVAVRAGPEGFGGVDF